jgi:hypothetical protein
MNGEISPLLSILPQVYLSGEALADPGSGVTPDTFPWTILQLVQPTNNSKINCSTLRRKMSRLVQLIRLNGYDKN